MPTVPRVTGPSIASAPLPGARLSVRADANDMGAQGAAALSQVAAVTQEIALNEQQRTDSTAILSARRQLSDLERSWFDPNRPDSVPNTKGKDALQLQDRVRIDFDQKSAQIAASLGNARQKQLYAAEAERYRDQMLGRVTGYTAQENARYQREEFEANVANSAEVAATAAREGDFERANRETLVGFGIIDNNARLTGEPPEVTRQRKRALEAGVQLGSVNGLVAQGKVREAEEFWRANVGSMGPKTREATAAAIIRGRVAADPSTQAVALGGSVPQVKPTPAGNIQADAAAAGVPPTVALAIANIESPGFNPSARPMRDGRPLSSAVGLFQMLDDAWEQYGNGAARDDVAAQSKAGVAYIADSYKALRQSLGREPHPHEIYMAHLFGQAGSQAIIKAPDTEPVIDVIRRYDPKNARAIVANNGMEGLSVGAVKAKWAAAMDRSLAQVATIPAAPAADTASGTETNPGDDPIIAAIPIEQRMQLQNMAEAESRQRQSLAHAELQVREQDAIAAFARGEQPTNPLTYRDFAAAYGPRQAALQFEQYRGWQQFGADVGMVKTLPFGEQAQFLADRRPQPGDGYADSAKRYDALVAAVNHVNQTRIADPIAAAAQAGGIGVRPLDAANLKTLPDQLALRVAQARQVAQQYGTPLTLLSKDEAAGMNRAMREMPSSQKVETLKALRDGATDATAFTALLQQIAPDQPVLGVAGAIMQRQNPLTTNRPTWFSAETLLRQGDVAALMIEGDALLNPTKMDRERDGKAGKFPMPKEQDMRAEFASEVGAAFAGDPSGAELAYQAARAYYAGVAARKGDLSGEYNAGDWRNAVMAATGGVVDFNDRGEVLLPWGMPEDRFNAAAFQAFDRALSAAGMPSASLWDYGLQTLADGRYLVRDGAGYLLTPTGRPVVIDVYNNTGVSLTPQQQAVVPALARGVRR